MQLPGTPSDEVADVLATGRGDITTLFVSMATRHPEGARRRISALAHPRPPPRAAPAVGACAPRCGWCRRRPAGPPARRARPLRRDRPRDDVLLHRPERADGFLALSKALGGADRKLPLLPPVERGVYDVQQQVGGTAGQGRRRRAAVVAGEGVYLLLEQGTTPPADLADVDGVGGRVVGGGAGRRRTAGECAGWPAAHVLLPRRRPGRDGGAGCGPFSRRGGRRRVSNRCSPRRSTRSSRTSGIAMCRRRISNAHRPDGRLRQGALTRRPAGRSARRREGRRGATVSRRSGFPRCPAISTR